VEVSEQDRVDSPLREAEITEPARSARPGVDDEDLLPGDHGDAGPGALRVGQWRARPAQHEVKPVRKLAHPVAAEVRGHDPLHHAERNGRAKEEHDQQQCEKSAEQS
jgi:hypothetical protein